MLPQLHRLQGRRIFISLLPLLSLTICSSILATISYVHLMIPAQDRLAQVQDAYQSSLQTQATVQANRRTQERIRAVKLQLDKAWLGLPTETEFASLGLAISELGRSEHVSIPGMQYGIEQSKGSALPAKASISFSVTGDYAAVYRFIHRLESADSYVVIESLDASRTAHGEKGSSSPVVFHLKVATFLRTNPPTWNMS